VERKGEGEGRRRRALGWWCRIEGRTEGDRGRDDEKEEEEGGSVPAWQAPPCISEEKQRICIAKTALRHELRRDSGLQT